jgi:hypothetical protein
LGEEVINKTCNIILSVSYNFKLNKEGVQKFFLEPFFKKEINSTLLIQLSKIFFFKLVVLVYKNNKDLSIELL